MLKLEINGVHTDLNGKLKKYVEQKIGKLDRFLPRTSRESAHAEVFLKEVKEKANTRYSCEVVLYVPGKPIRSEETTVNLFAAVDIVEKKLKNQLKKYKDTHNVRKIHRRVINRVKRR